MTEKKIYFLSGLPRTGSTLLGSILSQNPNIHVTPTSPLCPFLINTNETFNVLNLQYTFDQIKISNRVYHAAIRDFYADIEKPIIFDKHRAWPKHISAIQEYINPIAKVVCTIRPIAEIITSYLVLANKDESNFIDEHLNKIAYPVNNESRATLLWEEYLKVPYETMKEGISNNRDNLLLIEYLDIVYSPEKTIDKIYEFCGIDQHQHQFSNIENKCAEAKDEAWGLKDLHTIRPSLEMKSESPTMYLPKKAIEYFSQFDISGVIYG